MRRRLFLRCTAIAATLLVPVGAGAQEAEVPAALQTVVIVGRSGGSVGVADSATEGSITARQLATRPLLRAAEVLESVPGMTVTQHSGDGKANQYFLRGFNLDHGSDFATSIDGMPVNMVSHGHGQGYTDLNFLIPELIDAVHYRKGPYGAHDGDFAVAGSARIDYARTLPAPLLDVTVGEHDHRRVLTAGSAALATDLRLLAAIEAGQTDGPWEQPERLRKFNGVVRLSGGVPGDGFSITGMAYSARWTATEQVPQRAIERQEIGRFGTLAPTDGGMTRRASLSGDWARRDEAGSMRASGYLIGYGLNLFSTPSGLQTGQHEQEDRRTVRGGALSRSWELGPGWLDTAVTAGLQLRQDDISRVGLFETVDRARTMILRQDRVVERAYGALAEVRTQWLPWLRSTLGLRFDRLQGTVTPLAGSFNMANRGTTQGSQLSPKLSVAIGPFAGTEFYANAGSGFHSNDMRGATSSANPIDGSAVEPVKPIAKATSAEVGVRASPLEGWRTALSVWSMSLASELIYVGDEGVTEPKGASHRSGIEWWNDYAPNRWLTIDADLALSRARFVDAANGGTRVPNAIPLSASLGLSADHQGPWFGGVRLRYIGAYPLEETGVQKSRPSLTVNLKAGYRFGTQWRMTLDVLNLFDRKANDIEYWGSSCTRSEGLACNNGEGYDGRLVHPMEPRTVRLSLRAGF